MIDKLRFFISPKRRRWKYALLGMLLSFIGPLGEWFFIRIFSESVKDSFVLSLLYTELVAIAAFSIFGYIIGSYAEKLEKLAFQDRLTGLYNRHYMMEQLQGLISLYKRYQEKFSLIMLDLDHFKKVNDSYGHTVGDKTLKAVAKSILNEIRETDFASRFGGEEFIIVCPHTSIDDCYELAERIRTAIELLNADSLGFPGPQTISAGVSELSAGQQASLKQIINQADKALYYAKEKGRNKVFKYRDS